MSAAIDEARLLKTLKRLIAFPSPQPEMERVRAYIQEAVRPELPEGAFDQVFRDSAGSIGWRLSAERGEGEGEAGRLPLVLCAYAGNFPAESMPDPYTPKEVDGGKYGQRGTCLWGRGTCEQIGALAALKDEAHVQRYVAMNRTERTRVSRALAELGLGVAPSQANFVLVDFRRPGTEVYDALLRDGVIVRPMPPPIETSLRITIGTPEQNDRMLAAVAKLQRS